MKTDAHTYKHGEHEIEVGRVEHDGREFFALGAVIDLNGGHVSGYVARDAATGRWYLQSFAGEFMFVELIARGKWPSPHRFMAGSFGDTMYAWRAVIDGRAYSGRNLGQGMLLHLRAKKAKAT